MYVKYINDIDVCATKYKQVEVEVDVIEWDIKWHVVKRQHQQHRTLCAICDIDITVIVFDSFKLSNHDSYATAYHCYTY